VLVRRAVAQAVDADLAGEAGVARDVAAGATGRVEAVARRVAHERARCVTERRARGGPELRAVAQLAAGDQAIATRAAAARGERARARTCERAGLEPERRAGRAVQVRTVALLAGVDRSVAARDRRAGAGRGALHAGAAGRAGLRCAARNARVARIEDARVVRVG